MSWKGESKVDEERVQKFEKDGMVDKVGKAEQVEQVENGEKVENVMDEDEGMVKTPQIHWDFRQSEVRDELTNATNLEILRNYEIVQVDERHRRDNCRKF